MSLVLATSVFPETPSMGLDFEHHEMVVPYPSQKPTVQYNSFGFSTSCEVPNMYGSLFGTSLNVVLTSFASDLYVAPGTQWFDDNCQTNDYTTTNLHNTTDIYDNIPCASAGTSSHYDWTNITLGWAPPSAGMSFAPPFPSFAASDVNTLPSHTSWHLDMSQASTPSFYNGSSSSSSPISCPSPASWYGSADSATLPTADYQHPLIGQPLTIAEPAPVSHQDTQQLFDFLSTMQEIAPAAEPLPTYKSISRLKTKPKRVYKPRPVRPRVDCPNCGRGFCRTDALNRHLKNTCGAQCTKCVGRVKAGMACPHHRGTGRPLRGERLTGFVPY